MLINISIHADNPADYRDALKALNEGAGLAELDLGEILPEVKVMPVVTKAAPTKQAAPVQAPVPAPRNCPIQPPKLPKPRNRPLCPPRIGLPAAAPRRRPHPSR